MHLAATFATIDHRHQDIHRISRFLEIDTVCIIRKKKEVELWFRGQVMDRISQSKCDRLVCMCYEHRFFGHSFGFEVVEPKEQLQAKKLTIRAQMGKFWGLVTIDGNSSHSLSLTLHSNLVLASVLIVSHSDIVTNHMCHRRCHQMWFIYV